MWSQPCFLTLATRTKGVVQTRVKLWSYFLTIVVKMSFEVFSYESLVHAVSGAAGSVTAMTVFFPLDTARLRLQVDENRKAKSTPAILAEIIKEEGLRAPYRGWFPVICSLCCSNFVYFYCFHSLKARWLRGKQSVPSTDLLIGITAGVVNVLVTTPLWVVNTRLKLQGSKFRNSDIRTTNYSGILDAFVQIIRDEGVGALWNGTFPSLLLVLNPAIQFMIYEGLKRQLRRGPPRELSSAEVFIIGAVAKAVATSVTYPLQTIQSILRFGQHNLPRDEPKIMSSLRTIKNLLLHRIRKYGMLGLFKGLEAKLLQTVLTAALMFLLYEKIVSCTFTVMGLRKHSKGH
ncbi:peroxisomal membrane protein PMP34 [Cynoglossus semilaevis]|uniref:Solute carrier family 25 member 17 n=1 Tax=Cynoglossus semilaevis TaxID=244447 RepID=A0A3P8WQ71_CYNSE|nr:peroxisomal membrane protein PMP34-like [Cynoglossus semilaevis]